MIKADKHSIAGILLAIFSVAILAGTGILSPIFANILGSSPRELRLGAELGLIEPAQCKDSFLKSSLTKKNFAEKVCVLMTMLGAQNCDASFLRNKGISDNTNQNAKISRAEAVEMMARAVIYMNRAKIFKMSAVKASNFRDYRVPEKYSQAIGYMQSKFVVRGLPNNNLAATRKLSQREAIYFLYRLYEAISADMMSSLPNEGLCFIDISKNHPIMDSIKNLTAAGAFDRAILRPSFDGDSFITPEDITELIGGIFDRSGKRSDTLRVRTIFSEKEKYTTRKEMALILEYLLDSFSSKKLEMAPVTYIDVEKDEVEYQALSKLLACNINPGYGNNIFAAEENVTWFEAVNLINRTVEFSGISKDTKKKSNKNVPADKEDIERLKKLLISKKAMVRNILGDRKR